MSTLCSTKHSTFFTAIVATNQRSFLSTNHDADYATFPTTVQTTIWTAYNTAIKPAKYSTH